MRTSPPSPIQPLPRAVLTTARNCKFALHVLPHNLVCALACGSPRTDAPCFVSGEVADTTVEMTGALDTEMAPRTLGGSRRPVLINLPQMNGEVLPLPLPRIHTFRRK